uniref:SpoIIE family protein phosphatase n=1 Tax=Mycobacterium sp. HUMS_1102779 TaxID=3383487 RepID=UPI00389B0EC4
MPDSFRFTRDEDWSPLLGDTELIRGAYNDTPVILCTLDWPGHRLTACNAAYRARFPGAEIGAPAAELASELGRQGLRDACDRVYRTGDPLRVTDLRLPEFGSPRERFADLTVVPQRGRNDEIVGLLIAVTDITEQAQARMAAERRAEQMVGSFRSLQDAVTAMQQALLPPVVPVLPGADIAAAYLVAAEDSVAGGDWFDAIPGPAGRVALVVGDVAGHGPHATAVMAQLRTATRMQLTVGAGIGETLRTVDLFAAEVAGAKLATLCIANLATSTGEFEYCTAGHPPPLVIHSDATSLYLEPTGAGPLGSGRGFATRTAHLAVDDVVLLYSDGILQRPARSPSAASVEVADVTARILAGQGFPAESAQPPVERLCSQAIQALVGRSGYSGDITLLAAQRRTPPRPLRVVTRADAGAERRMRARLRDWLATLGADPASGHLVEHAVSEFVANAVEHAYAATAPGDVVLEAALGDDGKVRASVADRGTWKHDATHSPHRGRGLSIAHLLVGDTVVSRSGHGTTAGLTHRLTRAAHVVTDPPVDLSAADTCSPETFDIGVSDDGYVVVAGDVDGLAAPSLAGFLFRHSRAGARALSIDLSAVTHLSSTAVGVLAEACDRAARQDTACRLVAPPGGTAYHVLSLVGLPIAVERSAGAT